jgi:hypothetical protein
MRRHIEDQLVKSPYLHENICIHGFRVCVKERNLKRRSSIVKHSRFLRNLEVYPVIPPEPVVIIEEVVDGGENEEGNEDE